AFAAGSSAYIGQQAVCIVDLEEIAGCRKIAEVREPSQYGQTLGDRTAHGFERHARADNRQAKRRHGNESLHVGFSTSEILATKHDIAWGDTGGKAWVQGGEQMGYQYLGTGFAADSKAERDESFVQWNTIAKYVT